MDFKQEIFLQPDITQDTLDTLNILVQNGRATLYDLKSKLDDSVSIEEQIKTLKNNHLIAEKEAVINDFTTYYPTSDGLRVCANLKTNKMSISNKVKDAISSMSLFVS